jgi:hypothetical protein
VIHGKGVSRRKRCEKRGAVSERKRKEKKIKNTPAALSHAFMSGRAWHGEKTPPPRVCE